MKIFIYGLGAIGSNLLVQLIKMHPEFEYTGIDHDIVEERNIGPQAYFRETIGKPKVQAVISVLQRFVRNFKYEPCNQQVTTIQNKYSKENEESIVIDCFDNTTSRNLLAKSNAVNLLHCGFSPQYTAEIQWNEIYEVPNDIPEGQLDICTMRDAIPFIHFVVNFAATVISDFIEKKEKNNFIITNRYKIAKL